MIIVGIGGLIALGAAVVFLAVALLLVIGGADTTLWQILPGFRPDRTGLLERALTYAGVWIPIVLVVALCVLAGIRIFSVVVSAL